MLSTKKSSDHHSFKDLTGRQFNRWTALAWRPDHKPGKSYWECICRCGTTRNVIGYSLLCGRSKSCGCHSREVARATGDRTRRHSMCGTSTYHIWNGMLQRCRNPNAKDFHRYGAKGITVCDRWSDFALFIEDMGERPPGKSIDRIDNTGGYRPDNCRWADVLTQARNTSRNLFVEINGTTRCLAEWCEVLGIKDATVRGRRSRGWDIVRALTTPIDTRFHHA